MLNRKSHNYWTVKWQALQLSGLVNYTHQKISHMIWFLKAKFLTVGTYFNERFSLDKGSEIRYQKYIVKIYSTLFNEAPIRTYKTHCLLVIQAIDIYCDLNHADLKFTKNFLPEIPICCQYCSSLLMCAYSIEQIQLKTDVLQQLLN